MKMFALMNNLYDKVMMSRHQEYCLDESVPI